MVCVRDMQWGSWLMPEACSFDSPLESLGLFHCPNPTSRSVALGSIQSLTEKCMKGVPWGWVSGKGGRCLRLTTMSPLGLIYRCHAIPMSANAMPMPCRANSHTPCRSPAILRQCRVLSESPRGSRKYPKCRSYT
jgi:hypothetical protein